MDGYCTSSTASVPPFAHSTELKTDSPVPCPFRLRSRASSCLCPTAFPGECHPCSSVPDETGRRAFSNQPTSHSLATRPTYHTFQVAGDTTRLGSLAGESTIGASASGAVPTDSRQHTPQLSLGGRSEPRVAPPPLWILGSLGYASNMYALSDAKHHSPSCVHSFFLDHISALGACRCFALSISFGVTWDAPRDSLLHPSSPPPAPHFLCARAHLTSANFRCCFQQQWGLLRAGWHSVTFATWKRMVDSSRGTTRRSAHIVHTRSL